MNNQDKMDDDYDYDINSELDESILKVLLIHAQYNDSQRLFAGLRKPSKTTRVLLFELIKIYDARKD